MSLFGLPDEVEELRRAAARFAERELAPAARDSEAAGRWPDAFLDVVRGFDLGSLDLEEGLGGGGSTLAKVAVLEALAAGDPGGLAGADQPGSAAGALMACPDGAVARSIAAACRDGAAQCALVVAAADEDPPVRVEWAPSWPALRWVFVSRGDELALWELPEAGARLEAAPGLAFRASGGVSCALGGGPARRVGTWRLGPGRAIAVRGRARLWAAAVAVGVAQAAFDATMAYTTERVVFGRPVAHHQGNAFDLAVAATNLHGARLMVRRAAADFDEGDPAAGFWATQAWLEAVDATCAVTDLGIQLLGGHGFLVDHPAEKRFRETRMLALLAGGRDAADADLAATVLDTPDPLFAL